MNSGDLNFKKKSTLKTELSRFCCKFRYKRNTKILQLLFHYTFVMIVGHL